MNDNRRYSRDRYDDDEPTGFYRPSRQRIEFESDDSDSDFGSRRAPGRGRGEDPRDWSDDIDERSRGYAPRGGRRQPRYRDDYDDDPPRRRGGGGYDDDYDSRDDMEKPATFVRRHPVLMNFVYIIVTGFVLVMMLLWFLDYWTFHGQERVVPDVKGEAFAAAASDVDMAGLRAVITDSVFDSYSRPGTVVEQIPIPGAKIKKGGAVYLTVVAFSPKLVTVPDFYNVSVRQARSMFEGVGIRDLHEVSVMSEYKGLVMGAKFNGIPLQPGARIPVSAVVTLEVGSGYDDAAEAGADIDTLAIDNVIEELNIE